MTISSLKEGTLDWWKMVNVVRASFGKYVRSALLQQLLGTLYPGKQTANLVCLLLLPYSVVQDVEAWKHSDFLCHNYVLNGLVGSLYNVYCKTTTAKELWESLERKHKTKDAVRMERLNLGNSPTANIRGKGDEIGKIIRINDVVVMFRDKGYNDLQDERQDQPKEEEVDLDRRKGQSREIVCPDFVSFMVGNEPTSYREAVTSSKWLNGKKPIKVK
ncbi:hypothetical protein Tco_0865530 [Tanacetum coccineum]